MPLRILYSLNLHAVTFFSKKLKLLQLFSIIIKCYNILNGFICPTYH